MEQPGPRLNPFAFPAETSTRLKLLIVALCLLSVQIGFVLADRLGLPSPADVGALVAAASQMPVPGTAGTPGGELVYRAFLRTNVGLLGQLLLVLGIPLVLCGLMLAVAWMLYRLHPLLIPSRGSPPTSADASSRELQQAVDALAGSVGFRSSPRAQITASRYAGDMRIFGFPSGYRLQIGGGWRLGRLASPERFRALLLHELAHVVNGDVVTAYYSRALWLSFLVVVIAPTLATIGIAALSQAVNGDWNAGDSSGSLLEFGIVLMQGAVTLTILAAIRASLLRVRELYADWRVAIWGASETLRALLTEQASRQRRRGWWRQIWSFHPTLAVRSAMIDRPVKLFAVAHELAFFVGFLFALLIASLPTLLQLLGVILLTVTELWQVAALADPSEASLLVRSAAFAIPLLVLVLVIASTVLLGAVGFLLSETLGLEVQRASIADLAVAPQRSGAARMVGVAIFTAGGVAAGLLFAPFNFLTIGRPSMLLLMPFWTATFAGLLWLWCMGVYKAGQAVLGSHAGYNTPELKRRLLALGLFALTCAVWLPPLATQQLILPLLELAGVSPLTALLMILGSTGLALGGFGALALALWLAVALWRLSRPLRCPNCGYQQARGRAVGQLCARCGHRLAAWAYIDDQQPYVHALEAHSQ